MKMNTFPNGWPCLNSVKNIPKTELFRFLNLKDDNMVIKITGIACTENVKHLGHSLHENSLHVFHLQRVLSKLAKHRSKEQTIV